MFTVTESVVAGTSNAVCSAAGTNEVIYFQSAFTGSICASDGCLYSASSPTFIINSPPGTHYMTNTVSQGETCSSSAATTPTSPVTGTPAGPNACQQGASGVLACEVMAAGQDCGTFNGDEVCVTAVPDNSCVAYASGGVACAADAAPAPAGPAPNNGTAGTAATPTGQVSLGSVTVNYYSSSVVSTSSTGPTTVNANNGGAPIGTGSSSGSGSSGTGTGSGGGCGNGTTSDGAGGCIADSESGGLDCSAPPVCNGDPVECGVVQQEWNLRCNSTATADQLSSALGTENALGVSSSSISDFPVDSATSSCPMPPAPVSFLNGTVDFTHLWDGLCQLFSWLRPVVLAIFGLVAGKVLLGGL